MEKQVSRYSFLRGWEQLRFCDQEKVKKEIMETLNIKNAQSWRQRRSGLLPLTLDQYEAITEIFKKNGVDKKDVWQ